MFVANELETNAQPTTVTSGLKSFSQKLGLSRTDSRGNEELSRAF